MVDLLGRRRGTEYHKTLFDTPLRNFGSVRNICGEFVELLTRKQTGAVVLKTDTRQSICPDLYFDDRVWFECKSVGKSNFAVIYEHRHNKEAEFVAAGNRLLYWIWWHAGKIGACATVGEVRREIANTLRAVYVVDHGALPALLSGCPKQINSMYYSSHKAGSFKGSGWKVPMKSLREISTPAGATACGYVRGVFVKSIPMFYCGG